MIPFLGYALIAVPWILEAVGVDSTAFKNCTSNIPDATIATCKEAGISLVKAGEVLGTLAGGVLLHKANPFKIFGKK